MSNWKIGGQNVDHIIEITGVYDGWSVAVLEDGTRWNRWANDTQDGPEPGYERRYEATAAYLRGEEPNGRWF